MSNCKVIALTNQKGGVGKTTTAVNLGVCLSKQGKKVLLVDADAQANLTMSLGYPRPDDLPISLATIMQDIIDDKLFDVQKGILHHSEGVDLLPSNIELSGLEVRLINAISRERVLTTCINEVKKNYDYVLIDCMPSLGMLTINALAAADSVVIPTQPHYLSAKGLELLLRSVSKVRRQINPHLRIDGILMTMVMPRTNISKEVTALVRSAYGQNIKVFDAQIPHSIRLVLFFVVGVMRTCGNFAEVKRPEQALKLFIRFALAKGAVTYGLELMMALFNIVQGLISTIMNAAGFGSATDTVLPQEIVTAVEDCGFFESIPLWAVTLIGGLFITVLSFIMIMSVYGRFFKLYLYTAIAPVPLSAFAGEPSQSVGKSFIKSYSAVCLEGAIIVLACIIFSLFAAAPPVVNPDAAAVTMVWSYVGELIFNMLILVGAVKMADRVVREMMGL